MNLRKKFLQAVNQYAMTAGGLAFILAAYAFVQNDDERVRLEDARSFGYGAAIPACSSLTPTELSYETIDCKPE